MTSKQKEEDGQKTKKMTLTTKILLGMGLGLLIGSVLFAIGRDVEWIQSYLVGGVFYVIGSMFIKMLKMLVVPLVFCSLISGIIGMDDMRTLGRTGVKTFAFYMFTTALAIMMALTLAVASGIGTEFDISTAASTSFTAKEAPAFSDVLLNIVPSNIVNSMAEAEMLQVIFISIVMAIAIAHSGKPGKMVGDTIVAFNSVVMKLVEMVMAFAPYGVFALIAKTFAEQGIELIIPMAGYFGILILALIIHATIVYSSILSFFKLNPLTFFRKIRGVQLFAFSTASSNATIPVSLKCSQERIGSHKSISSFTIPFGATINMDGTAIMQGVATVFIANVYSIDLSTTDYLVVIGMSVMASIGAAGVPGVGLIMLAMVFTQVGLPVEGIVLIIGVDRLLDMARTVVNVTGDNAITAIVAKTEGKLDITKYNDPNAGIAVEYEEIEDFMHKED